MLLPAKNYFPFSQPIALALFILTIGVLVLPAITRRLFAKDAPVPSMMG